MKPSDKILVRLLTKREKNFLKNRYKVLELLKNGIGVREIAQKQNMSTATIVKLKKRFLPHLFREDKSFKRSETQKKDLPWLLG